MRRSIVFIAVLILVLAFGVQSGAQQPNPETIPSTGRTIPDSRETTRCAATAAPSSPN